ncbi:hypothetical protein ACFL27_28245 [candidate division CSSED10-310 bacterium]|uniref:Peptidase M30 n=1 Tax=candidate division CSSED10-310 bacterium TaxID=2855610 RepID=A0ABV6Z6N2_UNCC1
MRKQALKMIVLIAGLGVGFTYLLGGCTEDEEPVLETFWCYDFKNEESYQIEAELKGTGTHCKLYLEQNTSSRIAITAEIIADICQNFDDIYQINRSCFGEEPNPGVDNDPQITLLLLDIRDNYDPDTYRAYVAGYFESFDCFTQEQLENAGFQDVKTNAREMFYMDVDPAIAGSNTFMSTLAHEFQHMINFNQKCILPQTYDPGEEIWLNEAMSELAPFLCGYGPKYSRVNLYLSDPDSYGLTTWSGVLEDYAQSMMWSMYVYDRLALNVISDMVKLPPDGIPRYGLEAVEYSLEKNVPLSEGITDFDDLYTEWNMTVLLDSLQIPIEPWHYHSIELHGEHDGYTLNGVTMSHGSKSVGQLDAWAHRFFSCTPATAVSFIPVNGSASAFFSGSDQSGLVWDMLPDQWYSVTHKGFAVARNPGNVFISEAGYYNWTSSIAPTQNRRQKSQHELINEIYELSGQPVPLDVGWKIQARFHQLALNKKL